MVNGMKFFFLLFLMMAPITQAELKSGFFVGAQIGVGTTGGDRTDQFVETPTPPSIDEKKSFQLSYFSGGLFGGYLFKLGSFGIAPEIGITYGGGQDEIKTIFTHNGAYDNFIKIRQELGGSLTGAIRLGYIHQSYFLYGLMGCDYQKMIYYMDFVQDPVGGNYRPSQKESCLLSGITWGLGVQKEIKNNWHVGAEIRWTQFNRKSFTYQFNEAILPNTSTTSQFKNNRFALILKVSHHF